ncbi:transcription-repair coupling factor [Candidatus Desantisbacteria bacterium CG07_land_8_20_14_0_80_39_15]|uniref:Transcription-repair-coupling factor n=1 Tax=Candidatus Desantisbacteria bacterium CG07_land_8_20_14_0_80_39_15 TaxID=1974549 RepID=A0A2M6ZFC9_9BACT|nr:MAG: transcription-repair coupling factor [Candidatus Desantisbacteria bacterium CG07_land_8_20_14_0_80_39_15]
MKEFIDAIKETGAFKELVRKTKGDREIWLSNLCGSAFSCVIAGLQEKVDMPLLIILPEEEIEEIQEDLNAMGVEGTLIFPQRETLEGENLSPYSEVFSQRMVTLLSLTETQARGTRRGTHQRWVSGSCGYIVITSPQAIFEKLPSPDIFKKQIRKIKLGDRIDREEFIHYLINCGYTRCDQVTLKGDFSIRGGIIDIYIPVFINPARIELFGDEISSIREFDSESQISIKQIKETVVVPSKEFFGETGNSTLLDHLPGKTLIFIREPLQIEKNSRVNSATTISLINQATTSTIVHCSPSSVDALYKPIDFSTQPLHIIPFKETRENRISVFIDEIKKLKSSKFNVLLLAEYAGQAERMKELLKEYDLYTSIEVLNLSHGWIDLNSRIGVIVLKEVFGISKVRRHRRIPEWTTYPRGAEPLTPDDYVVHINYGIGIFRDIEKIPVEGNLQDFFLIEYAEGDKLYVPLDQLNRIQKYVGKMDPPPSVNRLGTAQWQRVQMRVKKSVEEHAKELLNLYAWRKSVKGCIFSKDTHWQEEFELGFPYEETPDQSRATTEVKEDMEKETPMDRLLCGDVGYGKTEVAIRSAFKAVMDGKQVAVLVPTTILAEQHFQTFTERMAEFPIRTEALSRFKSEEEQKKIIKDLKENKIEIIIGTHRLIQKDIKFHDLGLLIIDEEQRFGVLQKEYIKKLKKEVDVLTLSATPIPRTLYMSMSGIRDISIIETPPPERLSIRTFVMEFNTEVIRTAILREMERKGQVFYVHNRVETLQIHAHHLKNLIPDARIAIAHGQMEEKTLEKIMIGFLNRELDVLVSTDIIGAGLDIANANTIIVTDAQDFGLAQLYQLRGRVGRAGHQAYAYIFYNPELVLTDQAHKRLKAISEFVQLGSGLKLAMKDLEIRGAGNILGRDQHGHIQRVGLELYCKMLEETVAELKGEPVKEEIEPVIKLKVNAHIPDEYIGNIEQKTILYKRMVGISDLDEIKELKEELRDRFGELPEPVKKLMEVLEIRILAKNVRVRSIEMKGNYAIISHNSKTIKIEIEDSEKIFVQVKKKILEI